jgi:hypothetical protein
MWSKVVELLWVNLVLTAVSRAATLVVDLNGGADYTDIQSAIHSVLSNCA